LRRDVLGTLLWCDERLNSRIVKLLAEEQTDDIAEVYGED
jgi:hypothetical protein